MKTTFRNLLFSALFSLFTVSSANAVSLLEAQKHWQHEGDEFINSADGASGDPVLKTAKDVKILAVSMLDDTALDIIKDPSSRRANRDLADSFHVLGHALSMERDFVGAIEMQLKALEHYRASNGLKAQTSYGDGIEHSLEHIFMAMFDYAVIIEDESGADKAAPFYKTAKAFLENEVAAIRPDIFFIPRVRWRYALLLDECDSILTFRAGDR